MGLWQEQLSLPNYSAVKRLYDFISQVYGTNQYKEVDKPQLARDIAIITAYTLKVDSELDITVTPLKEVINHPSALLALAEELLKR